ncbi:hypothetical protein CGMCC3_g12281 [Colletotrichum fructicola]|uniref:Uncharacterized protein n=1 Tax=Colletotrichum fructicola (strain Nara gc5) TaxID=1213859 RepID=A0A7J6J0Q7_COLFN|nr:uncharacterized protein CGMCC3_g12281 [Colletotrichum fructicola]KAE9571686.1 hypothetical protein CGMCC3_g12281 [Colletotrichum fructicola]KAF4424668.1 hypothetical protein CFRS1_v012857 [Colletotrichum fructicola]KAF4483094.1 hypothetical protein CGGC5_v009777 [Colletotrichum fructicola Nara gc5]
MELEDARKQLAKYCVLLEALRILMDDDYNQTVQNRPIPPGLLGLPRPTPDRRNGIPETFKEFLNALAEIKYYRKRLGKAVKEFMERCKHSILNKDLKETLENILLDIEASKTKSGNDRQEYRDLILKCGVLIGHEGTLFKYLRDANVKIPDCWGAIFHYAERLQSYRTSVRAFFQARTEYDELFANPVANLVPPKTARQVPVEWTLQDLTNYFNSSEYRKNLWGSEDIRKVHAEIQRLLGESREGNEVGFHRIVHAEVALTHWFYSERPGSGIFSESSATRKFFGDYHYVATSKPCCLMCKQFCDLYVAGIRCRPFHTRIYARWTLPGFEDCYTKEAEEELLGIYMSMAHKFEENCSLILAKCKPEFARSSFDEEEHFDYDDFRKRTSLAD